MKRVFPALVMMLSLAFLVHFNCAPDDVDGDDGNGVDENDSAENDGTENGDDKADEGSETGEEEEQTSNPTDPDLVGTDPDTLPSEEEPPVEEKPPVEEPPVEEPPIEEPPVEEPPVEVITDEPECLTDCFCVPGSQRYCDTPTYCSWGIQHCADDGLGWGECIETSVPSECENANSWDIEDDYSNYFSIEAEECCIASGFCCQDFWDIDDDGDDQESLGSCDDVVGACAGEICNNGIDDDGDCQVDCDDLHCASTVSCWLTENCFNDVDDNGDGRVDCDDPLCIEYIYSDC